MFSENNKGIGVYLIYSAIFHILLIGLIIYLSIRYRPEIQSIGSKVVVSVVSRVPGPLASVKSILYPPRPKAEEHPAVRPVPVKSVKPLSIPLAKSPSSMVYPKKTAQKQVPVRRYAPPHPYVPALFEFTNRIKPDGGGGKGLDSLTASTDWESKYPLPEDLANLTA